ncbi:hypothetical protein AB0E08_46330 [Streptomyces sp. NPDC048281]|uniref:hypothetical protein n=1 Tax=Streptomyces sp. NPDC048281 TaxID=3154715 RepID=UPI00341CAB9F
MVEGLLVGAVEAEHAGHVSLRAVVERVATAEEEAARVLAGGGDTAQAEAVVMAAVAEEERAREGIAGQTAARLSGHEVAVLLRELVRTAYPDGRTGAAHPGIAMIRAVLAGLLARDTALLSVAARAFVYDVDLEQVHAQDQAAYRGPRLARTVLDLAGADADAGVHLAERIRRLARVAAVDDRLHDRLLATHLTARPPPPNSRRPTPGLPGRSGGSGPSRSSCAWWPTSPRRRPPASSNSCSEPARPGVPRNWRRTCGPRSVLRRQPPSSRRCCRLAPSGWTAPRSRSPRGCGSGTGRRSCPRGCWPTGSRCWTWSGA